MGWSGTSTLKITPGVEGTECTGFGDFVVGREETTKGEAGRVDQPLGSTGVVIGAVDPIVLVAIPNPD